MAVSGWLSSWATPAAISPMVAIRDTCSSRPCRAAGGAWLLCSAPEDCGGSAGVPTTCCGESLGFAFIHHPSYWFATQHPPFVGPRSEEHTSELQSLAYVVCRLLL